MIYPHKWVDCVGVIPHVCISYVAILSGKISIYLADVGCVSNYVIQSFPHWSIQIHL
jgi:hypothetical protein